MNTPWECLLFLVGMIGFAAMIWHLSEAIRYRQKLMRLDHAAMESRPLMPDDRVAALKPGDTVILMLSLDDMTCEQQKRLMASIKETIEPAKARGIEFIVIPDWKHKAIVVSRSILPVQHDNADGSSHDGGDGNGMAESRSRVR